jgi:hypothetical protein
MVMINWVNYYGAFVKKLAVIETARRLGSQDAMRPGSLQATISQGS